LLGIALAACGGGGDDQPTSRATVPDRPATTVAADPYAVPATIDAAYLNRVFLALEEIDGQATRLILENKAYVPEAALRLNAIYGKEEFDAQTNLWVDLINQGLTGFKSPAGNRRTITERVLTATPQCVYAAVVRDYSAISQSPPPNSVEYVALRPLDHSRDSKRLNPTPWMIVKEGYRSDGSVPPDPCS
jgi:hypothetical protein